MCIRDRSGTILFSSCVGSFGLFNRISSWNQSVGNKFVNELVFLALNIVPVYGVAYLADALVINSIEFWSGSNPMAKDVYKRQAFFCTGNRHIASLLRNIICLFRG